MYCYIACPLHGDVYAVTAEIELDTTFVYQITVCLWPARYKWRQIGLALRIHPSTLEVIRQDNPLRTDDCVTTMIEKWLTKGESKPCWMVLAEALKSPPVGVTVMEGN